MKSRYWSFIVYPESVKGDWIDILVNLGCVFAVSPLHDKDVNPDGELKKPHYHVLVQFDGPTTYKNVNDNICALIGATIPKNVISMRGYYRYLTHMDNPEKYQYNSEDIKTYGGFKIDLTTSEINSIKSLICIDIENNSILEYSDLVNFYLYIGDMDKFEIVSNHVYFFNQYITSLRNKKKTCK